MSPTKIAPVPFTQPALGVIATSPQSMPLMAPRNVGFFCLERNMSQRSHVITPTAVATLVLSTAEAALGTGVEGVATVEAVPAEPDDARADGDHHQVARERVLAVLPAARPEDRRADEGRDARREVDDVATGVVDGALLREEPATPEQRRVDAVDARDPQRHDQAATP